MLSLTLLIHKNSLGPPSRKSDFLNFMFRYKKGVVGMLPPQIEIDNEERK